MLRVFLHGTKEYAYSAETHFNAAACHVVISVIWM